MVGLELDLRPGQGVGNFELGTSLWNVLEYLQQHVQKTIHPQVDIKYDSSNPSSTPVVLHIRPHIDLLFSPLDQRLTLINIRRLRAPGYGLTVKYRDKTVSSSGTVLRRATVNQDFGPTYPGDVMKYPGISFAFEEDGVLGHSPVTATGHGQEDRNQEVKRIIVTQKVPGSAEPEGHERDALDEPLECPEMHGELKKALVQLDRDNGLSTVSLTFHLPPNSTDAQTAPVDIRIGETTAQDLIADIGSPLRTHYKEDDRMSIHKPVSTPEHEHEAVEDDSEGYFYNYFQYGFDILLSGSTHVVQKVILHSNVPGTYLFQRYKRCNWEIEVAPKPASLLGKSPGMAALSLPPVSEPSILLEPPSSSKGPKKGKKKSSPAPRAPDPEPSLIELTPDIDQGYDSPAMQSDASSSRSVSLFDKIDVIKSALAPLSQGGPVTTTKAKPIPVSPHGVPSRGVAAMRQLSLSTSPPTMVLDRTSDAPNVEMLNLVGSTSNLMGFDGLVLEVSELGDVLSVVVF